MPLTILNKVKSAIIKVILYFEVFRHPLRKEEILFFLSLPLSMEELETNLKQLCLEGVLKNTDNFFLLDLSSYDIERRLKAELKFRDKLAVAHRFGTVIAKAPFVRGVCLSGTMSKGVMYEKSDIDYFIITSPGRLWIAKLFLVFYRKFILRDNTENFCINYFIDTAHLSIEERNQFTATELATTIPIFGFGQYEKLIHHNNWMKSICPNTVNRTKEFLIEKSGFRSKSILERLLNHRITDWVNQWLMRQTQKRNKKKFGHLYPAEELAIMLKSKEYVSKGHLFNNQKILLTQLAKKEQQFETSFNLSLS